ncbi:MAG: FmdB family transcriptional regulator [Anaerolineae bacterium]|nr:FmdB family transcriptional regulator [Anaerolineae bacterium]
MPLYGYECKECGVRFERRQGFDDEPIKVCPECEGEVHRLIQPAGIVFKGSGFYSTDNKRSRSTTSASGKKSESSSSDSDSKTESKAESKTESKTESTAKTATSSTD